MIDIVGAIRKGALDEGIAIGRAERRAEDMAEGIALGRAEVINNYEAMMRAAGIPEDVIEKFKSIFYEEECICKPEQD